MEKTMDGTMLGIVGSTFFAVGVAVGVGSMIVKDKYMRRVKLEDLQRKIDNLCNENEKYRKRNKDLERQVEDLLAENTKLRKQVKAKDDMGDDLEDELEEAKSEVKKLRLQNDDLYRKLHDNKEALDAKEVEISMLKEKLDK